MEAHLNEQLRMRKQQGLYRRLKTDHGGIDFASNDYLGFARRNWSSMPELNNGAFYGATGSRLLTGNSELAEKLETDIARYHGQASALLFNNGYMANLALFATLPQRHDTILLDEFAHASMIDGSRLSNATVWKFTHNDANALETKLKRSKGNVYIGIESVYSMSGERPNLADFTYLANKYNARLIVDEAHAVGVIGEKGEGVVATTEKQSEVAATVVTFGKALGCHGAAVLGSETLRDYLINFARPLIYTTALPEPHLRHIQRAYSVLADDTVARKILLQLIAHFRNRIEQTKWTGWRNGTGAIQSLVLGDNDSCTRIAFDLQTQGFRVYSILYPTVKKGEACLRFCLHSYNTAQEIDELFEALKNAI